MPGVLLPVPIPVAHYHREPEGDEALLFTSSPANAFTEQWVAVDADVAIPLARRLVEAFERVQLIGPLLG